MPFAILDIEATGGKAGTEKIIDISIYKFDGIEVLDQFGSMVNPQRSIDPYVQKLTRITEKMVSRAPKFYELAKRVIEITEDCTLVGHGVEFDYRMLRQEFRELGYVFERKTLDTLSLSQQLIPEAPSHSLGKITKSLGIPINSRHTAEGDTRATLDLFKILLQKDKEKNIIQTYTISEPKSKIQVSKLMKLEENLTHETGVFYLLDENQKVIYLSAAKNIKNEVNDIFIANNEKAKRLQTLVHHINFEITGSFLIAQLKQFEEVNHNKNLIDLPKHYFNFGIYVDQENSQLLIENVQKQKGQPLLLFHSKRNAYKVLNKLNQQFSLFSHEEFQKNLKRLNQSLSLPYSNMVLIDKGRKSDEHGFIEIQNKTIKGYGFYTFYNQLESAEIRENLLISIQNNSHQQILIKSYYNSGKFQKTIELNPTPTNS